MAKQVVVTIPAMSFDSMLLELERRWRGHVAVFSAGERRRAEELELLHRSTEYTAKPDRLLRRTKASGLWPVVLWHGARAANQSEIEWWLDALERTAAYRGAALSVLGTRTQVRVRGWIKDGNGFETIDALFLPGRGMLKLGVEAMWPARARRQEKDTQDRWPRSQNTGSPLGAPGQAHDAQARTGSQSRFNRLVSFLGEGDPVRGAEILRRARQLRVVIFGCGRLGYDVALDLAQAGVGCEGWLIVVDGDVVEEANLDVMRLPAQAVGVPKALATAAMAELLGLETRVWPIVGTLSSREATEAAIASDIIVTCVDRDAPRVGVAALAERYDRVHLDMTAGAAWTVNRSQSVGGEVRLSVPGSRPCVGCCGITMSLASARHELNRSERQEKRRRAENDPERERPGSCGAVVSAVKGVGILQFWRLLQGKQRESVWLHLDLNGPEPAWLNWARRASSTRCEICSRGAFTGLGDSEE